MIGLQEYEVTKFCYTATMTEIQKFSLSKKILKFYRAIKCKFSQYETNEINIMPRLKIYNTFISYFIT